MQYYNINQKSSVQGARKTVPCVIGIYYFFVITNIIENYDRNGKVIQKTGGIVQLAFVSKCSAFVIVEQITCIFGVNRANNYCDTSTKVGMAHLLVLSSWLGILQTAHLWANTRVV